MMIKFLVKVFLVLVVLALALVAFKNQILKAAATFGVQKMLDMKLEMDRLDVSLARTFVQIDDLKLYHPPEFYREILVDLPHLYVDYDPKGLAPGDYHLERLNLHLRKLYLIRNKKGDLNIGALRIPKLPPVRIDRFQLRLEEVIYQDHTFAGEAFEQVFKANVDAEYQNVESLEMVIRIIIAKAVRNSTVARLTNLRPDDFVQQNIFDTLTVSDRILTKAAGTVEQKITGAGSAVQEKAKGLVGAVSSGLTAPFRGGGEEATD